LYNYGSNITNSIADSLTAVPVYSYGQHISVNGVGEDLKTFKYGSFISVERLSKDSTGQEIKVSGASGSNKGVNISLGNRSGWNNWGQYIALNSPAPALGAAQNIYGQEIAGTASGNSTLTYKWGQKITLSGTASRHYGISLDVSGASTANVALEVIAGRSVFNVVQDATSDLLILGDTDAALFIADVSADSIGIGTATPETKLDVRGTFKTEHNPNSPLIANGFGYGDIVTFGTSSGALSAGRVYYLNSTLVWTATDANAAASATGMLAIAIGTAVSDGMLVRGYMRSTNYTFTNGQILYLSAASTGLMTATAPSGSLDIVRIVGYLIDETNDIIYFNPSNDWVEI
jgi:hypothetical protein